MKKGNAAITAKKSFWSRYSFLIVLLAGIIAVATAITVTICIRQNNHQVGTVPKFVLPLDKFTVGEDYSGTNLVKDEKNNSYHTFNGVIFKADKGTQVKACADGKVTSVSNTQTEGTTITISINGLDNVIVTYKDMDPNVKVKAGQKVKAGDVLGVVGTTALHSKDKYHVYLEFKDTKHKQGEGNRTAYLDPQKYLPQYRTESSIDDK